MINGKFFTGLPEKMMEKSSNGPNRQRTNFFWPDETDSESVSDVQTKRNKKRINEKSNNNQFSESPCTQNFEPKDLYNKQLTSKIEFYDVLDTKKTDNSITSSPSPSLSSKSRNDLARNKFKNTYTSKIEFYDYVDNNNHQNNAIQKTDKNSKKELEKNSKNSPKLKDKRIKFIESEQREIESSSLSSSPKSILKNNEAIIKAKSMSQEKPNQKIITKRNISKSVENLPRSKSVGDFSNENNIKIIENDVKNLRIRKRNDNDHDQDQDNDENVIESQQQKTITRTESKWGHQSNRNNEESPDRGQKTRSRTLQEYKPDFDESYEEYSSKSTSKRNGSQNYDNDDDDFYYDTRQNARSKSRRGVLRYDTIESESNEMSSRSTPTIERNNQFKIQNSMVNNNDDISSATKKTPPSEKIQQQQQHHQQQQQPQVNRAHRHLVSNISSIFFGGYDNDNETTTNRANKNARNSAVSRVSVGLPD